MPTSRRSSTSACARSSTTSPTSSRRSASAPGRSWRTRCSRRRRPPTRKRRREPEHDDIRAPGCRCSSSGASSRPAEPPSASLPARGWSALRLDLDLPPLGALGLRDAHGEHALVELRLDLVAIDVVRQDDAVLEAPQPPGALAQYADALALLD